MVSAVLVAGQLACLLALASPWGGRPRVLVWGCVAILLLGTLESIWLSLPALFPDASLGAGVVALFCQGVYGIGLWTWWQWRWQRRLHET